MEVKKKWRAGNELIRKRGICVKEEKKNRITKKKKRKKVRRLKFWNMKHQRVQWERGRTVGRICKVE